VSSRLNNTREPGGAALMSDDNGVPRLQLRAPERDHGPPHDDGPDTADEGQVCDKCDECEKMIELCAVK
jgi:hypothetical protein